MVRSSLCLCLLLTIVLLAGAASARSLDEIRADGTLVMLSFPHQESLFVRTDLSRGGVMPKSGGVDDFVGIDVDIAAAVALRLGVELEIVPVSEPRYGALIPELLAGRADLIGSSFTITEARDEHVDFSRPYFTVYPVIVVRRGREIESLEDLDGLRTTATAGSSHEERLHALGIPEEHIVPADFSIETYARVVEGEADYTLVDSSSARSYIASDPSLEIAFRLPDEDHYGFAVPPESDLVAVIDEVIAELEASGELERIVARHFGG